MGLLVSGRPLEVQHFGFQLLQTLVRTKDPQSTKSFADLALSILFSLETEL
jgi:hypothetical protein